MKSLTSIKTAAFVGLSSLALAIGLFAAPAATFANENGRGGDHRGGRSEHRGDRGDRGDRREGDRHEGDREGRGERFEGRWDWDQDGD